MSSEGFKADPSYLVPVALTLVTAYFLTLLVMFARVEVVYITLFPEGAGGPLINAALFISMMCITSAIIYAIIKRHLWRILNLMFVITVALVVLVLTIFYVRAFTAAFRGDWNEGAPLTYTSAAILTAIATYGIFKWEGMKRLAIILLLGGGLGAFLGVSIPTGSAIALLILLSLYDVVAVYLGPVGKIASEAEPERLRGISFTFRKVRMGLGDIVFYSMLASRMLLAYGLKAWLASSSGILVGVYLGLKALERKKVLPGLPMALAFGLMAGMATLHTS